MLYSEGIALVNFVNDLALETSITSTPTSAQSEPMSSLFYIVKGYILESMFSFDCALQSIILLRYWKCGVSQDS